MKQQREALDQQRLQHFRLLSGERGRDRGRLHPLCQRTVRRLALISNRSPAMEVHCGPPVAWKVCSSTACWISRFSGRKSHSMRRPGSVNSPTLPGISGGDRRTVATSNSGSLPESPGMFCVRAAALPTKAKARKIRACIRPFFLALLSTRRRVRATRARYSPEVVTGAGAPFGAAMYPLI